MLCLLGVAANCASALAQMAAASCVQEEKDEKEAGDSGDAISQGVKMTTNSAATHDPSTGFHLEKLAKHFLQ